MNISATLKDLTISISRGDSKAFRNFYDVYSNKVYQFSKYFVKAEEICEEIVSDVFINVWNTREKLPEITNIEAYLYIITRNKAYNYIDKQERTPEFTSEIPGEIHVENGNPEDILLTKELEKEINASIQDLPERCRVIFLMSRQENLKYHEIAEILSLSEKTVHAQIVTALKKLNTALKNYLHIFF